MLLNTDESFFESLWDAHFDWSTGILYSKIVKTPTATIYLSDISGEYYNLAVPTVENPEQLNFDEIDRVLQESHNKTSFTLFSKHQDKGFSEYLIRKGFKSHGGDCWVVLDQEAYTNRIVSASVAEATPESFKDYYSVLSPVFKNFPGNEMYLDLCLKSIKGELSGKYKDLVSKLYIIYDNGKPASGAGLFYSKESDIAYLHDGGTLPEYRGKGYQTALLRHRSNIALEQGISRIYSSVEPSGQSWSNCIKVGFTQTPWTMLLVKDDA
jgi:GNAT superfamily N-acetyltransferase